MCSGHDLGFSIAQLCTDALCGNFCFLPESVLATMPCDVVFFPRAETLVGAGAACPPVPVVTVWKPYGLVSCVQRHVGLAQASMVEGHLS
jgi:hypothetical protein